MPREAAVPISPVQAYCEGLGRGELVARKCSRCARITFPPADSCEHCGSYDVEWATLSGRGTLLFATPDPTNGHPHLASAAPGVYGHVRLEEGVVVQAVVTGTPVTPGVLRALSEHGTIPVVAAVLKTDDGLPVLAFTPTLAPGRGGVEKVVHPEYA
ncbi:MAG TPA: zinc ribbon domain-containing protein [Anaeromyxobacteraceae bacterium]|nr:zinc ribbon domain-containing protein [Anaeromyxobacteraceae bacterium]